MEAYEAILTRRSIRAYTDQPVSEELIHKLLVAAMSAPSAANGQPWQFAVITERRLLDALADFLPFGKMLKQAPLAIIVCGETKSSALEGYWVQDCAAATENLLLAAHVLGLGGVWLGVYPRRIGWRACAASPASRNASRRCACSRSAIPSNRAGRWSASTRSGCTATAGESGARGA